MKAYGKTDIGSVRKMNQDYIFYSETPVGNLPNLFIVADGMGGHKAGDVASRTAVETFVDFVRKSNVQNPISLIEEGIHLANTTVFHKSNEDENYSGMGTTMVVAVVSEKTIYIANVGDSRLYLIDDTIRQITRDHSLVEEMVNLGELKRSEARHHAKKNVITRAIGGFNEVVPDFFEVEYQPGNRILLCSDGLTNMVDDSMIRRIVLNNQSVKSAVEGLIAEANRNGGKDNISAVLVQTQYSNM